jgi:hypothetical protein
LIGGAEVTGHAEAKFQKKAQQLPSSSVDPALADLEHARALAVLNSLNSAKAKCGYGSSFVAKSVEARIKVFTP